MRIRYSLYLILSVALLAGGGCASGKWPWSRKPKTDANTVIQPNLIDEQTGAEISSHGTGAFDETRERVTDVEFAPVYFGFDSYSLAPIEVAKIENVARYLLSNSGRVLVVEGHCDERGSNEYNLSLGEQRANTVRNYIVNLGVNSDRVQTRSYGEEKPAATGHDEASWRLNRRGEFAIYR